MKVRVLDAQGYPIDHSAFRFKKIIPVPSIPKAGSSLELATTSGRVLTATVERADWNEEKGLFVVACQYAKRSISAEEYAALADDPDWRLTPLI